MANDRLVINYMSPADLVALMNATGIVVVHDVATSDGKPVIHASVKVVNAETGEQLPGGLPFSVVMFKGPNEPAYSNIAIGTIVPASELKVVLPRDYFNFCNQRFRFTRVFPVDESSFVIQMDLVLKNATREYLKFTFGLWGALFSQMLFELMGRGRESLIGAAEAFALAHIDFAQQIATTPEAAQAMPVPAEAAIERPADAASDAVMSLEAEAIVPIEAPVAAIAPDVEAPDVDASVAEVLAEVALAEAASVESAEAPQPEVTEPETPELAPAEAETVTAAEASVEQSAAADEAELSIVAGPAAAETATDVSLAAETLPADHADAKDLQPV